MGGLKFETVNKFCARFRQILRDAGTEPVLSPIAQFECAPGALLEKLTLGMSGPNDLLWGVGVEARHPKLREPLPRRTQSSGFEQSTDRGRPGSGARDGQSQLQGTTRRDATLLIP